MKGNETLNMNYHKFLNASISLMVLAEDQCRVIAKKDADIIQKEPNETEK